MNILQEIKLLLMVRKPAEDLLQEVKQMKPGWQTTEFWVKILGDIVAVWGAVHGFIPADKAAMIVAITSSVYAALRTILKVVKNKDLPDFSTPPAAAQ